MEIWKQINDFPNYEISNLGNVRNVRRKRIKKQCVSTTGYKKITLYNDEKRKNFSIHRLIAIHFIPNPNNYPTVDHIDRNKLNNNLKVEKAGAEICNNYKIDSCLITRGGNGMSLINREVKYHVSSVAKEIFDVSGAGDTVIASFAAGIVSGSDFIEVTKFANEAAGIVVGHIGTSAITLKDIKNKISKSVR